MRVKFRLMVAAFASASVFSCVAQQWTLSSPPTNYWSGIACSANGSNLVIVAGGGDSPSAKPPGIFISTNAGATWAEPFLLGRNWSCVASSADGENLVAAAGFTGNPQGIYTSTNGGLTWISNNLATSSWRSVACSADGSKIYAVSRSKLMATSTDFGATWSSQVSPDSAWCIASSADGQKLVAGATHICMSTNGGLTWVTNNFRPSTWGSVASSADGNRLLAAEAVGGPFGNVYRSIDAGNTWITSNLPKLSWQSVASSANGTNLIATSWLGSGDRQGPIYTSTNGGLTWISNNIPMQAWTGVASSADGNIFYGATSVPHPGPPGPGTMAVWASKTLPNPTLNITSVQPGVCLSWTIPSSDFILEHCSNLSATNWLVVTNAPVPNLTNFTYEVRLPVSQDEDFFRLQGF